nr:MAG TPA: adenosine deaminase [Caudoviricetes sp.]
MAASPTMPTTESTTALQSEMKKSRYRTEIRKIHTEYPYHKALGKKSPYNERIIRTEDDYDLYCHCYALFRMYEKDMAEADNKLLNANVNLSLERHANAEFYEAAYKRFRFMRIIIYVLCAALAYFIFFFPRSSSSDASTHQSSSPSSVSSSSSASSSESSESSSDSSGNGPQRPDGYTSNEYVGNKKSHRFHRSSCSYLPDEDNQRIFKSRDAAISAGYDPCGHCNP